MDAKTEARLTQDKPSLDGFELPCGYLDSDGNIHTYVEVSEFTGEEEETLAAKNMPPIKKLNKILSNCIKAVGDIKDGHALEKIVPDLTQGDRMFLLFAIRRVTLGDEFPFATKCPNCEHESKLVVDLSELEIRKMPDPKIRVYDLELPKSKKKVTMKVMTGRGEESISKAAAVGKDIISTAILARMEALDGKPAGIKDLKSLSMMDRNYLRDEWQEHEGGIDTNVDIQCSNCDHAYATDVDIGDPGFFSPASVLKRWKKTSDS